jgi:hypothetical protein
MFEITRERPDPSKCIYQLKYGDKIKPIPDFYLDFFRVKRAQFYKRSSENITALEKLYGIKWHTFLKYTVKNANHCGYVSYGSMGRRNITYIMYKHNGMNIGDVFIYFANGKRIYCTSAKTFSSHNKVDDFENFCYWSNFIEQYCKPKSKKLKQMMDTWIIQQLKERGKE